MKKLAVSLKTTDPSDCICPTWGSMVSAVDPLLLAGHPTGMGMGTLALTALLPLDPAWLAHTL